MSLFVSFDGLVVLSRSCVQIWLFADIYLLYVLDTILCEFEVSLSVTLLILTRILTFFCSCASTSFIGEVRQRMYDT